MKKVILIFFIFASSILSAETVYVMSLKDYYGLCAEISACQTDIDLGQCPAPIQLRRVYVLKEIKEKLKPIEKNVSFSSDIDLDIVIKVLEDVSADYKLDSQQREETNKSITYLRTKIQNEIEDKNKLTPNEKLSILGGDINLLEMRLIYHEMIMKKHGWKIE